jgi:hypothetical protein
MPKLAAVIDSLESVAEPLRQFYVQEGERFVLDADAPSSVALERKNRELISEQRKLQGQIKTLTDKGLSVEQALERLGKLEELERLDAEKKGNWEQLRGQMAEQHQRELAKKDERVGVLDKALRKALIEKDAVAALRISTRSPQGRSRSPVRYGSGRTNGSAAAGLRLTRSD